MFCRSLVVFAVVALLVAGSTSDDENLRPPPKKFPLISERKISERIGGDFTKWDALFPNALSFVRSSDESEHHRRAKHKARVAKRPSRVNPCHIVPCIALIAILVYLVRYFFTS
uniref:Uncharacterized protein n=1 Tax=Spongospora subterranea TaxID=70186 RepID=A0A0H5R3I2_9EUKA|eukprot:CRZ08765.1 hypothetical protein [Spongospora subterranea]